MKSAATTGAHLAIATFMVGLLNGCSIAAAPMYARDLARGGGLTGDGHTGSFVTRGTVHPQKKGWHPLAFGIESELGGTSGAACCRSRITPLVGASWLKLAGSQIGAEVLGGLTAGQTAVDDRLPFSLGATVRGAMPVRIYTGPTWPCPKKPHAALGWFLTPEVGLQGMIPLHGDDHGVRTEAVFLLWLRTVGWTGLPLF